MLSRVFPFRSFQKCQENFIVRSLGKKDATEKIAPCFSCLPLNFFELDKPGVVRLVSDDHTDKPAPARHGYLMMVRLKPNRGVKRA